MIDKKGERIMNNLEQDYFIFNYLEGNLGESEHDLCEELIDTDIDFKNKVEQMKSSYFLKSQPTGILPNKQNLIPKKIWPYWLTGIVVLTFAFYHHSSINTLLLRTEQLEQKLEQSQHNKLINILPLVDHHINVQQPKEVIIKSTPSSTSSNKQPVKQPNLRIITIPITSLIDQPDSSIIGTEKPDSITIQVVKSVKTLNNIDTIADIYKDTNQIIDQTEEDEPQKKKKKFRLYKIKEMFDRQTMIPIE